jgi:multidrug efflux pump subunit AcrB
LKELPDVTHTRVSMTAAAPKLVFDLDEAQLRRIGLERVAVANAIDAALRGRVGGSVLEDTEQIPVRAQLVQEDWQRVNELRNLRIPVGNPTSGKPAAVPLSTLGDSRLVPDDSPITRIDGERVNQIQGYLTRGVLPEEALALLKADLQANPIPLPPGYHYRFGGDSEERAQVVSDLMGPLGLICLGVVRNDSADVQFMATQCGGVPGVRLLFWPQLLVARSFPAIPSAFRHSSVLLAPLAFRSMQPLLF